MRREIISLLFLGALILGLGKMNVFHHLTLPQEVVSMDRITQSHFINFKYPFVHLKTDIQMAKQIASLDRVREVTLPLQQAEEGDVVVFHLAGYGGFVDSVYVIANNIKKSKAYVIMEVEGSVYSGHAYLAVLGDELRMEKHAYLMFHTSTLYNTDCSKETGVDRNMTNQEHCEVMKAEDNKILNELFDDMQVLTTVEKKQILDGKDLYLDSKTVNSRIHKGV